MDTLSLDNICNGEVPARFQRAIAKLMTNIRDPNAPAKAKRKLTLTFTFEPHVDRSGAEITCEFASKLVSDEAIKGNFYMAQHQGELRAYPRDPRQELLFGDPGTDPQKM